MKILERDEYNLIYRLKSVEGFDGYEILKKNASGIHPDNVGEDIKGLKKKYKNYVLVPHNKVTLVYSYPWEKPISFEVNNDDFNNYTIEDIIYFIGFDMIAVFKLGKEGKLGYTNHSIEELVVEGIDYKVSEDGENFVLIYFGS